MSKVDYDDDEAKGEADSLDRSDVSSADEYDSDSEIDDVSGLTVNQKRLLYMMSLYTHPAETEEDKERWIRQQALMVLIYEGVVARVYDYDYAPSSEVIEGRRNWFNMSQEGSSDVDFLREEELINGLKVRTKDHRAVTCFQISMKGLDAIRTIQRADKEEVHTLCFSPFRSLMVAVFADGQYWLVAETADENGEEYRVPSSVTHTEDVSYVSSAYVPACLRQGGRPTMSNAHRATESAASGSNLRDELDVIITLNSVSVIVAEYVPFGANQMVELNHTMGATGRVQGGFVTGNVDTDESGTNFHMDPGMTQVQILDYSLTNHVNFEADIHVPEDPGIVQVETFGCSINAFGTCFFGLQLEAVMDRIKDGISLDHLSRLLADVHVDSSRLVDALLTRTQNEIIELVFRGDGLNRNKVNLIVANEIVPHLTAEEYMDKGEYENELKQVLGETRAAFDISQYDTLIFGAHGMLLTGPNSRQYEPLLCAYLQFVSLDLFIRNYYNRLNILQDDARTCQGKLSESRQDPISHNEAKAMFVRIRNDIIIADKTLTFLTESLEDMGVPASPSVQAGKNLYDRLALERTQVELARRVTDVHKFLVELKQLVAVTEHLEKELTLELRQQVQGVLVRNTREMVDTARPLQMQQHTLVLIMGILLGNLSFDVLDRLTGSWSYTNLEWFESAAVTVFGTPGLWMGASLFAWLFITVIMCLWVNRYYKRGFKALVSFRSQINRQYSHVRLEEFLADKKLHTEDWDVRPINDRIIVSWDEVDKTLWGGTRPRLQLEYSAHIGIIHAVTATYNQNKAKDEQRLTAQELRERVMDQLVQYGVVKEDDRAPKIVFGRLDASEVRAAAAETKRKLPPKRRIKKADDNDIMLDADSDDDAAKSSALRR